MYLTIVEASDVNVLKRLLDHVELCVRVYFTSRPIFMAALRSSPSLAFSYIGSITARHSINGRQPNFAASYKEWNYGTFADGATYIRLGGHHVGHRPTF